MSRAKAFAFSAAGGAVAAVLIANVAFAQDRGFGDGGFGRRHRGDGMMLFFPLLLLIAAAVLVILLWRGRQAPTPVAAPPAASPTFNAQAILADRLARGEITPDDYRAAITVLREPPPPPPPVG
jgi:putative membrane protein